MFTRVILALYSVFVLVFCVYNIGSPKDETYAQRISELLESVDTLNVVYRFDELLDKVSLALLFFQCLNSFFSVEFVSHFFK